MSLYYSIQLWRLILILETLKLLDQLLASQLVLNALLDEFSNMDGIYESYKPTIRSAVQVLKTDSENMSLTENP